MNRKHINLHPVSMTEEIISLTAPETELLLTRAEAALILRTSPKTLANWASAGIGPRSRRCGRTAVYLRSEIESYVANLFEKEAA
ncbi:helix-turn-helix domain-containing protein [Glutamicibacter sp. AOP5-A2-18]|uniref:helix-turn-helix domain-containing protein n=1 Tax=Glutamicibacter sp. AOP5-A2-18 TaxID=3457656 RepID=UPI0040349EE2